MLCIYSILYIQTEWCIYTAFLQQLKILKVTWWYYKIALCAWKIPKTAPLKISVCLSQRQGREGVWFWGFLACESSLKINLKGHSWVSLLPLLHTHIQHTHVTNALSQDYETSRHWWGRKTQRPEGMSCLDSFPGCPAAHDRLVMTTD